MLVSIVTPSFNQAPYLEETLRSVAEQDYPHVEHIVLDGGSTDGSVEIIRRWAESHAISWHSGPDSGQADAIQRGVTMARGTIVGWLNSDDIYLDGGVLSDVVKLFEGGAEMVTGGGWYLSESGVQLRHIPVQPKRIDHGRLLCSDSILQPATFIRRDIFLSCPIDTQLHYAFDWDLFIRLSARAKFTPMHRDIAGYRLHPTGKTVSGGVPRKREILAVTRRYHGRYSLRSILTLAVVSMYRAASILPAPADRVASRIIGRLIWASNELTKGHGLPG
jgi:glycosyltransferase involved in cell wall biosynthesis